MSLVMSRDEREAFLADLHVGVLCVNQDDRGPLSVPVWYTYTPGNVVSVITAASSRKAHLVLRAGRLSLCVQTETAPYKYVSVEGPVASTASTVDPAERQAMAYRYLGQEIGDLYLEATAAESEGDIVLRMTPEHWLSTDYTKQFG
jgi:nitroimidazol reductase NimA-like FMN-containing flavoprotein (pyridoxamine 5'-phosphate oxidase superfamily)